MFVYDCAVTFHLLSKICVVLVVFFFARYVCNLFPTLFTFVFFAISGFDAVAFCFFFFRVDVYVSPTYQDLFFFCASFLFAVFRFRCLSP